MPLRSAFEDFVTTTLAAVPGCWGKLQYISGLRRANGRYAHWGLARLHGDHAVQTALSAAHTSVFQTVLRSSLRELLEEACTTAAARDADSKVYLAELRERRRELLPRDLGGGSEEHFSSILEALSALARSRPCAKSPAA